MIPVLMAMYLLYTCSWRLHVLMAMYLLQLLSVSYERFAVALDEKFGQIMWVDFPQTANKGKG